MKTSFLPVLALPLVLSACGGGSSPSTAINLPVTASGTILAAQLGATQTSSTGANGTEYTTTPTEVQASDRTSSGLAITVSSTTDPSGNTTRPRRQEALVDTLTDVAVTGALDRGATFTDVAGVEGTTYFEESSFGETNARTDARTQIAGVSVYLVGTPRELVLHDVSAIEVSSFDSGTNEGIFGVGFIGNETAVASVPTANQATYSSAILVQNGYYRRGANAIASMRLQDASTKDAPSFDIIADFGAATLTADIANLELVGEQIGNTNDDNLLTDQVVGLFMQADITGNSASGTQMWFTDAAGNQLDIFSGPPVGETAALVSGGFFGEDAAEVAMSGILEGTIYIDDMDSGDSSVNPTGPVGFILSLTAGGAQ